MRWSGALLLPLLGVLGLFLFQKSSIGTEVNPLQGYTSLGTALTQSNPQQHFFNQLFTEETLTVTKEGDGFLPGTLRTVLLQAAGIRHNNAFALVKIVFDPSVRKVMVMKGNLPPIEDGLTTLDCGGHVTIDGTLLDSRYLNEGESIAGITLKSSGNMVRACQIVGFKGHGLVIVGNRNQIRENKIGTAPVPKTAPNIPGIATTEEVQTNEGSGIFIVDQASENNIEQNEISGNKQDGITFSPQVGPGNRIAGNIFQDNTQKGINAAENFYRTSRPILKPIMREGDGFVISGNVSDTSEIEIYMAGGSGREGKMTVAPVFTAGRGDFSISVKSKGFIPGVTKIVALATTPGRNTSEFSEAVLIPVETPRTVEPTPATSSFSESPKENRAEVKETSSTNEEDPNSIKPLNEKASSALSVGTPPPANMLAHPSATPSIPPVDPFLNSTTIPPSPQPISPSIQSPPPTSANEPVINVQNQGSKSGESDSLRVESTLEINGAP